MKEHHKIPTVRVCDLLSLVTVGAGACAAFLYLIGRPVGVLSVFVSFLILLGFFVVGSIVRILGIVGQNLFDLARLNLNHRDVLDQVNGNLNQVNCDLKDINVNIREIKSFFDQMERYFNLKK